VAFWRNPEFVRHVRAEMRAPRAITMAALTLVICGLVGLSCWGEADKLDDFFKLLHFWLVGIQFAVLGLWCASACGQAISRERELKTFDFLRTTRLTAAELMVGKVLGAPIMAYFVVACSLPVSLLAGVLSGISLVALAGVYLLLLAFALYVGVVSLWVSMLLEKANAVAAVLAALVPLAIGYSFRYTPFSGFSALSPLPGILSLYGARPGAGAIPPTILGFSAPFLALSLFLYAAFGAWFVLMLVRNLKKGRDEMRLLSRWQAIGFVAFLNLLYYSFLDPRLLAFPSVSGAIRPQEASAIAMVLNSMTLFLIGVALIGSRERLKVWWRKRLAGKERYFSGDGLVWPWLLIGALVAYVVLGAEALGLQHAVPLSSWRLGFWAVAFLNILVFIVRDVVFLQWCTLTRMKRPLLKGFLYLWLYYTAAGIVAMVMGVASRSAANVVSGLFTPWLILSQESMGLTDVHAAYVGMGLQAVVAAFMVTLIARRLSRPPVPAVATAS
jgi:hypothetical protein